MTDREVADLSARMARMERMLVELLQRDSSPPDVDRSLSRRGAADILGLHPKSLAKMTTTDPDPQPGMVTGYRIGRQWRYRMSDLDRYRRHLTTPINRRSTRDREIDWGV